MAGTSFTHLIELSTKATEDLPDSQPGRHPAFTAAAKRLPARGLGRTNRVEKAFATLAKRMAAGIKKGRTPSDLDLRALVDFGAKYDLTMPGRAEKVILKALPPTEE